MPVSTVRYGTVELQLEFAESFAGHVLDGRPGGEGDNTGAMVWPGCHAMCEFLTAPGGAMWVSGCRVLELGAGAGVLGCVLARLNPFSCLITDANLPTVELARCNLTRNGLTDVTCEDFNWEELDTQRAQRMGRFDRVFGADIVYPSSDRQCVTALFATVYGLLCVDSSTSEHAPAFVLAYVHRTKPTTQLLFEAAEQAGFRVRELLLPKPSVQVKILCFEPSSGGGNCRTPQPGEEIYPGLYAPPEYGSDEEFRAPFTGSEDEAD
eukprot:TRINITY_DN29061_c0_g1_i1.p1 TRINITY_DN29061_c0_g1~~TRINITY_DN29061_c0_g1_i1.p1  ORF type:complete len:266 (-),score=35.52 TRINITY_DN29061_c0_g1_i1:8-805(-)